MQLYECTEVVCSYLNWLLFGGRSSNRSEIKDFLFSTPFGLDLGSPILLNNDFRLRKGRSLKLRSKFYRLPSFRILGTAHFRHLALHLHEGEVFYVL